jgi:hypothetical protein
MDHDCLEVMLVALFHLGGHHMCPSPVLSHLGNRALLGSLDRSNVPFLFILNTFHLDSFCCPLFWKWLLHVSQKGLCLHPPMRRWTRMSRLMQLVKK